MESKPCFGFITVPDIETAEKISRELVSQRLAACVNIISGIKSIYMWEGKLCDDSETLLLVKSAFCNIDSIEKYVTSVHPYELPEIIFTEIDGGSLPYIKWLLKSSIPV
ncbi:divalent-cation tolerance protein CutA [Myxococcota bacterium]|nr:divalent-cation tolerance protein CutA [Myxococcota bacterium]MBU1381294.1 divalent-cation tolerance protein CutA [Myxococcota bacterium]MBU1495367.1 divalent-cation tolerance protein CutA [Myxococcota bacterium]